MARGCLPIEGSTWEVHARGLRLCFLLVIPAGNLLFPLLVLPEGAGAFMPLNSGSNLKGFSPGH
jgi:hypothetical protein